MGIVYQTKQNHVFETDIYKDSDGVKYAIDAMDIVNIMAYPLKELTTLGDSFAIICKYYPSYSNCDEAGWLDDLDCLIEDECDEEKRTRLTSFWGSDPEYWKQQRDEIYKELLMGAIENYKNHF